MKTGFWGGMRLAVFIALSMLVLQNRLDAQEDRRHVIWLLSDFSIPSFLDEGYSLFPRFGPALGAELGYDYRGRVVVNEFGLGGKYVWPDSPYGLLKKDLGVQLNVADNILFPIDLEVLPLRLYVGGGVQMAMNVWLPRNRLNISYQSYLALNSVFRTEWEINKRHKLRAGIYMPFLGVSWRPAWTGHTTAVERSLYKDGLAGPLFIFPKFFSMHNWLSFTLDLRYTWMLSDLINLYADYSFMFMYSASARPYQAVDHSLHLGMEFKL